MRTFTYPAAYADFIEGVLRNALDAVAQDLAWCEAATGDRAIHRPIPDFCRNDDDRASITLLPILEDAIDLPTPARSAA